MARAQRPALIGDSDAARSAWLARVLDEDYGLDAVQSDSYVALLKSLKASNEAWEEAKGLDETASEKPWLLLFIAHNLPPKLGDAASLDKTKTYFSALDLMPDVGDIVPVFIAAQDTSMDWRGTIPPRTVRLSSPPLEKERKNVSVVLDDILTRIPSAETKVGFDEGNRYLREQIRALSEWRTVEDGKGHLARLISRCIDSSKVEKVEIKSLGQGKSGASVFRVRVEPKKDGAAKVEPDEFVLKLCRAGEVWKLASEVRGHMRVQANKGAGVPGYKTHVPELKAAQFPSKGLEELEKTGEPNRYIVRSGHWYATHYDFLGREKFGGEFIDLETALICSAEELEKKTAGTGFAAAKANQVKESRRRILDTILNWLSVNWYSNLKADKLRREVMVPWDVGDAPEREYITVPPYKLPGRVKGWIQSFLNSPEAEMGSRFFADWQRQRDKVFRLVSEDPPVGAPTLGKLAEPSPFLLSQVHGDLNANNIMVWLAHEHPFLIDFPFYQDAGHALQDFARLEAELKFALLDRQKDSPEKHLKAFEHTYSQMSIWQELEDRLIADWKQKNSDWPAKGYAGNVRLCFEFVQLIRDRALAVQQNDKCPGPPAGDFLTEYWPALLYHTVRSIGYPSLSVFKRLLAVYSAGSILTELNCYPDLA